MIALKKILSVILSFILLFPSYLFSFLPSKADTDFAIEAIAAVSVSGIENGIIPEKAEFDFGDADCGWFNYLDGKSHGPFFRISPHDRHGRIEKRFCTAA